jgi:DNA-binding NtrC family response regulator
VSTSPPLEPVALVVDDEPGILHIASKFIQQWGFQVLTAHDGREAIEILKHRRIDIVMVDLRLPDVDGLSVLGAIRDSAPDCRAILMTGHTTEETRLEAVKLGALDYLPKPLDWRYLEQRFASVRDDLDRRHSIYGVESEIARRLEFAGMIGRSGVMTDLFDFIRRLAPYARVALITGETGTGKELVARAMHQLGPRRDRRFVAINCSAVVETLFESELFGHVRGAFTGAVDHKAGMFEQASGGTIFLDEIGELPLSVQAKLLRALEQSEIYRVGGVEPRRIDVHVLAATNRDLRAEVAAGRFRSDLFYRLNVVEIQVPPLRARHEDIPYLTAHFLRVSSDRLGKSIQGLAPSAERILSGADWPGNVRELRNVIERACILADNSHITERELRGSIPAAAASAPPRPAVANASNAADGEGAPEPDLGRIDDVSLATVSRDHVRRVLERAAGNKKNAAEMLGISRRAFYRLLGRLNLNDKIRRRK